MNTIQQLPPVGEDLIKEYLDGLKEDFEGEGRSGDFATPMKDWFRLQLLTGILPVMRCDDGGVSLCHSLFLEHGRVHQSIHDPGNLQYVGGTGPF